VFCTASIHFLYSLDIIRCVNTHTNAIRILCYGDSNTWGDDPRIGAPRYPANVRWTGKLQEKLGDHYEVIEEGLCGRTTVFDDPKDEARNGKNYLTPCIFTHNPIDIVILMLGSNDLKERFNLSALDISKNIEILVKIIQKQAIDQKGKQSKIVLLSPTHVNENIFNFALLMQGFRGAGEKSKQLALYYEKVAKKYKCEFIDIAQYVEPSKVDGCHLEKVAHAKIAELLGERILNL
jgi:lysophospholipase L1-like esterase